MNRPADNPFASHRVEALGFRGACSARQDLMQRVEDLGGRVAIVGPKGAGKTTLLEEFGRRFEAPVVRIPGGCRDPWRTTRSQLPRPLTQRHAVLVDGSEQLGPIAWRRLLHATRAARCLIVTLHRPGRLPTLWECRTDPGLLRHLIEELAPDDSGALVSGVDALFQRHEGNLRSCFRELYDVYARRLISDELIAEN